MPEPKAGVGSRPFRCGALRFAKGMGQTKRSRCARVRVKPTSNALYAVDHCWRAISGNLPQVTR